MIQNFITNPSDLFTSRDIETNKKVILTAEQKRNIETLVISEKRIQKILAKVIFPVYFGIFICIYLFDTSARHQINNWPVWLFISLILVLFLPLILYLLPTGRKRQDSIENCSQIKGIIKKIDQGDEGATILKIDEIKFMVNTTIYDMIREGDLYIFYYIQPTSWKIILSWEKL
jgi:hypothetical protein